MFLDHVGNKFAPVLYFEGWIVRPNAFLGCFQKSGEDNEEAYFVKRAEDDFQGVKDNYEVLLKNLCEDSGSVWFWAALAGIVCLR